MSNNIFKYKFALLLIIVWASGLVMGQNISAKLSQSKVGLGKYFTLSYEMSGGTIGDIQLPDFENFEVVSGPNHSSSTTIINGQFSSSKTVSFKLKALKEGIIAINKARVTIDGKPLTSNPVSINVIKGFKTDKEKQQDQLANQIRDNLIVIPIVSNKTPVIGEPITIKYKLLFNVQIEGIDFNIDPNFQGFYQKDITPKTQVRTEKYKGHQMQSAIIAQYLLVPQKFGEIQIPSFEYAFTVNIPGRRSRDIWSSFFDNGKRMKVDVPVAGVKLNISDLPKQGKPRNFEGAVGTYTLESSLSKKQANTNEAISLKLKIRGKGNIKFLNFSKLNFPDDIEVYDPKITENIKEDANGMSGSKNYEYLLIPRYAGSYKLPSIAFSYYDTKSQSYKTIETPAYPIEVEGESKLANINNNSSRQIIAGKSVDLIGADIRHIKQNSTGLKDKKTLYFKSGVFWSINGLALISILGLFIFKSNAQKFKKDDQHKKQKRASKLIKKYLAEAQYALDKQDKLGFYEAISKAIYKYTSDKLNIENIDLNKATLQDLLAHRGIDNKLSSTFLSAIQACDMARYAPSSNQEMNTLFKQVKSAIIEFDKVV